MPTVLSRIHHVSSYKVGPEWLSVRRVPNAGRLPSGAKQRVPRLKICVSSPPRQCDGGLVGHCHCDPVPFNLGAIADRIHAGRQQFQPVEYDTTDVLAYVQVFQLWERDMYNLTTETSVTQAELEEVLAHCSLQVELLPVSEWKQAVIEFHGQADVGEMPFLND